MRVTIGSSSNDLIDNKYKESAQKVCEFLASNNCDLNWGSGSTSIMGICYQVFSKYNRNIYGYTTPKYKDMISDLPKANHQILETTFDLRKNAFRDADLIVFLPGGTGTTAELFAYLEEARSNDVDKPIIIYNENHHFDSTLSLINDLVQRNFNSNNIFNYFIVANSFDDFKEIFLKISFN